MKMWVYKLLTSRKHYMPYIMSDMRHICDTFEFIMLTIKSVQIKLCVYKLVSVHHLSSRHTGGKELL